MTLTPSELAALKAKAEAATPGPWEAVTEQTEKDNFVTSIYGEGYKGLIARGNQNGDHYFDTAHIVAFNPAVALSLINEITQLREQNSRKRLMNDERG